MLYCPKKTNLFKAKSAKMLYCPKKNQSLETLGSSRAWRSPNFGFFGFFGTVRHVCLFWLKKIGFFGTVQRFCSPRPRKRCTVPKKPIFLRQKVQKCCTVPKKPKKNQSLETLGSSRAWRSPNFGFFGFFGTVRHFCLFWLKKIVFFGTVQRFCSPRPRKCCTVPKKPIFLRQKVQKCCTVPKKPKKNQSLETLGSSRAWRSPNFGFFGFFGTVRHFCLFLLKKIGFFGTVQRFCSSGPKTLVQ